MKLLITTMLMLASSLALATKHPDPPKPTPTAPPTEISNTSSSTAKSGDSISSSYSSAGAESAADSNSSSSAAGGKSESSLNQNIVTKVKGSAPSIYSTGTNNNVPCHGEWHVGASAVGAGIGFGRDRKDVDCLLKAAADDQYERANYSGAAQLYCGISYYQKAFGGRAPCVEALSVPPPDPQPITVTCDDCATKQELEQVREDFGEKLSKAWRSSVGK